MKCWCWRWESHVNVPANAPTPWGRPHQRAMPPLCRGWALRLQHHTPLHPQYRLGYTHKPNTIDSRRGCEIQAYCLLSIVAAKRRLRGASGPSKSAIRKAGSVCLIYPHIRKSISKEEKRVASLEVIGISSQHAHHHRNHGRHQRMSR